MNYAVEVRVIESAPRVRLYKVERPEIVCWDFNEFGAIIEAAHALGLDAELAVVLAGDAGLRVPIRSAAPTMFSGEAAKIQFALRREGVPDRGGA